MSDLVNSHSAIDALPPLREVISSNDLRAEKAFGQNFLLDLNLTGKIAKQAGDVTNAHVLEIGPGPGGLTRALLKTNCKQVTAIEIDPRAVNALQSLVTAGMGRLSIVQSDALALNIAELMPEGPRYIVANLPYNVATPLLIGWLKLIYDQPDFLNGMVLMFQKEVAERIIAPVGSESYGRLGIVSQWLCKTSKCFDLPPGAFTPPPKVTSSVVKFVPQIPAKKPRFETLEQLTSLAFQQRRKMLRNPLKAYLNEMEQVGISPETRGERVPVEQWLDLALAVEARKKL